MWIVESFVVLLDARDLHNVCGCTLTPPFIDEYGEPDPGLRYSSIYCMMSYNVYLYRRGEPLNFNEDIYKEIQELWLSHKIPERVHKEMEQNLRLIKIKWSLM